MPEIFEKANKNFWLVKFAPFRTSWEQIVRAGSFTLRGVKSPAARKNLASMRVADPVLFYRSQQDQAVVGIMEVTREAYPDPTSVDPQWLTCDFRPLESLPHPVPLEVLRSKSELSGLALLRQPRLAVMPVLLADWEHILSLSRRYENRRS